MRVTVKLKIVLYGSLSVWCTRWFKKSQIVCAQS